MGARDQAEFREVAAELLYTPRRMRCAHLARLERLIPELLPDRMYTYEYIFHRITLFHLAHPWPEWTRTPCPIYSAG